MTANNKRKKNTGPFYYVSYPSAKKIVFWSAVFLSVLFLCSVLFGESPKDFSVIDMVFVTLAIFLFSYAFAWLYVKFKLGAFAIYPPSEHSVSVDKYGIGLGWKLYDWDDILEVKITIFRHAGFLNYITIKKNRGMFKRKYGFFCGNRIDYKKMTKAIRYYMPELEVINK